MNEDLMNINLNLERIFKELEKIANSLDRINKGGLVVFDGNV